MNRRNATYTAAMQCLGILLLMGGCVSFPKEPISRSSIADLKVSEDHSIRGTEVSISGWYFNSSLSVARIETTTSFLDGTILIKAYASPPSKKTPGDIRLTFLIPPGVNQIDFGKRGETIWRRPSQAGNTPYNLSRSVTADAKANRPFQ